MLGSLIIYLKGMRRMMFQLSGCYNSARAHKVIECRSSRSVQPRCRVRHEWGSEGVRVYMVKSVTKQPDVGRICIDLLRHQSRLCSCIRVFGGNTQQTLETRRTPRPAPKHVIICSASHYVDGR